MGSLKCDLSHITVHTVNNHTHTLQGDSNARRQPSGNRYTYPLACTCAHIDIHTDTHPHTNTINTTHTHKKTCMYTHRNHVHILLKSEKKVKYNQVKNIVPLTFFGFNFIQKLKPQYSIGSINGSTHPAVRQLTLHPGIF